MPFLKALTCTVLLTPILAWAKIPTVQLSITGPDLAGPVHTSEADAIAGHVWMGNFAVWEAGPQASPGTDLPRYRVHFWAQPPNGSAEMKYVVDFVWNPDTQSALLYLPGPRDPWFRTNTFSILRSGQDGHWFPAEPQWAQAVYTTIRSRQVAPKAP